MTDLVTYYVETGDIPGPASVFRNPGDDVPDRDFYRVHEDEAERVMAWLRKAAEVGRDNAGQPPTIGEWSVGEMWWLALAGPLSEDNAETMIDRLGMTRRACLRPLERDLGLRVLRSDQEGRWSFELHRHTDDEWHLSLKSFPCTDRAARDRPQPPPETKAFVRYQAVLDGRFAYPASKQFEKALGLVRDRDIDDEAEDEYGQRFLPNGRGGSMRLAMDRDADGVEYLRLRCWDDPDPAVVNQLVSDIHAAAAQAGLTVKQEVHNPGDNS